MIELSLRDKLGACSLTLQQISLGRVGMGQNGPMRSVAGHGMDATVCDRSGQVGPNDLCDACVSGALRCSW